MITFTPDAEHVVVGREGELLVADLGRHDTIRNLPLAGLRSFAAFDDGIWAVAGEEPRLHRFTVSGRPVGESISLPGGGQAQLVPAPFGPPAAVWLGQSVIELREDLGSLMGFTIEPPPEFVVPIESRRWLSLREGRLWHQQSDRSEPLVAAGDWHGRRLLAGSALFDGRLVALVVEETSGQSVFVLRLQDGAIQNRIPVEEITASRFAPVRGHAILRQRTHELIIVDCRFGSVLKRMRRDQEILDYAIDMGGRFFVEQVPSTAGDVPATRFSPYRDLFSTATAAAATKAAAAEGEGEAEVATVAAAGEAAVSGAAAAVAIVAAVRPAELEGTRLSPDLLVQPLLALRPRAPSAAVSPQQALRFLDEHLRLVGARCEQAIADGWDSGRLAYPGTTALPFADEVEAILGHSSGRAAEVVATSRERLAECLRRHRLLIESEEGKRSPLALLAQEFGLSPVARDILLVVAAPTLWGELARLYAIVSNDTERPLCDELLVSQILDTSRAGRVAIARALDEDGPLLRHGLIRLGAGQRPFVALSIDPIVVSRLEGEAFDQADPGEALSLRHSDRQLEELMIPPALLGRIVGALTHEPAPGPLRMVLRGRMGSGRRTLMAVFAERAHRHLGVINAPTLAAEPRTFAEQLRRELRRVALRGWLPCVSGLDEIGYDDPGLREQTRTVLRGHPGPVLFRCGADASLPLDPGHFSFDLPPLTEQQRADMWHSALARRWLPADEAEQLAARYNVGPGIIERVVAQVATRREHDVAEGSPDAPIDLEGALRQYRDARIGTVATHVKRLASWSSVVLPPDIIDSIREFIGRIRHRRTVYESWGLDRVMTTSRGITALFQGGPGTGKTMVAGVIARELGFDLYRIDLARILSKWIGETERNLGQVFDAAEEGQAILLFDEADSLFAKRTEVRSSVDRYANVEVNYLLQRLDSFEGIAVLATNSGGSIDSAFKRRLSFRLTFPFPDAEAREQLWRVHLPPELPTAGTFDFRKLAQQQLSGGYIRNAVLRAAFLAAQEGMALSQDHLERAIKLEYRELGKLYEGGVLE